MDAQAVSISVFDNTVYIAGSIGDQSVSGGKKACYWRIVGNQVDHIELPLGSKFHHAAAEYVFVKNGKVYVVGNRYPKKSDDQRMPCLWIDDSVSDLQLQLPKDVTSAYASFGLVK